MIRDLIIITGMSGSGKSIAAKSFEDLGYFCIDNLPIPMLPRLLELLHERYQKLAVVADVRQPDFSQDGLKILKELKKNPPTNLLLIFLDSDDQTLTNRYAESRRPHPLTGSTLSEILQKERQTLLPFKRLADLIIDTSKLTPHQLRQYLYKLFSSPKREKTFTITLLSFGFKYGVPIDHDYLFDVRFLPNPYWLEEYRPLTGRDQKVAQYLEQFEATEEFFSHLLPLLSTVIDNFQQSDRLFLRIAFGCTGGKHRSVFITEKVAAQLKKRYRVKILHRDIEK